MSGRDEKGATTWQSKIRVKIAYPSALSPVAGTPSPITMWEITTISVNKTKEQRTINTVVGARKGFITVEGDLTGAFTVQETDPNLDKLEELAATNDFFDIIIEENESAAGETGGEWTLSEVIAQGCKIEEERTRYDPLMLPLREFTFKYLQSSVKPVGKEAIKERTGIYWDVQLTW